VLSGTGTRGIDKVVDLPELPGNPGRRALYGLPVRDIHLLSTHRSSGIAIKFFGDITNQGGNIPESNIGAFCGEGSCDGMPDPLGCTDDDSIVTRELKIHARAPSDCQD
jgi:hypothetical protein